eukprot:gene6447-3076_t
MRDRALPELGAFQNFVEKPTVAPRFELPILDWPLDDPITGLIRMHIGAADADNRPEIYAIPLIHPDDDPRVVDAPDLDSLDSFAANPVMQPLIAEHRQGSWFAPSPLAALLIMKPQARSPLDVALTAPYHATTHAATHATSQQPCYAPSQACSIQDIAVTAPTHAPTHAPSSLKSGLVSHVHSYEKHDKALDLNLRATLGFPSSHGPSLMQRLFAKPIHQGLASQAKPPSNGCLPSHPVPQPSPTKYSQPSSAIPETGLANVPGRTASSPLPGPGASGGGGGGGGAFMDRSYLPPDAILLRDVGGQEGAENEFDRSIAQRLEAAGRGPPILSPPVRVDSPLDTDGAGYTTMTYMLEEGCHLDPIAERWTSEMDEDTLGGAPEEEPHVSTGVFQYAYRAASGLVGLLNPIKPAISLCSGSSQTAPDSRPPTSSNAPSTPAPLLASTPAPPLTSTPAPLLASTPAPFLASIPASPLPSTLALPLPSTPAPLLASNPAPILASTSAPLPPSTNHSNPFGGGEGGGGGWGGVRGGGWDPQSRGVKGNLGPRPSWSDEAEYEFHRTCTAQEPGARKTVFQTVMQRLTTELTPKPSVVSPTMSTPPPSEAKAAEPLGTLFLR